jgi:trigger factor
LNIQTERIENHLARLTVEVEQSKWDDAKSKAARDLSKRYKIPGFRKGKAPYSVVVRYLGEPAIVEAAVESFGNDVYRDALEQSKLRPYTSGSLEDFKLEPQPTYVFTVPLQPEIELGQYRDVRKEYTAPTVTDTEVEQALRRLQQRQAVVADSENPVQIGDRVTLDLHSEFADGEEPAEDDEEKDENAAPRKGDNFIHRHDAVLNLDPEMEPILPGFNEAMVGASLNESREFDLSVPTDDEDYATIAGRQVHFNVTVKKIQTVTLPELNDEFAAEYTKEEETPLTLEQLRERNRADLEKEAQTTAQNTFAEGVLDTIVGGATVVFPDAMVSDRIHEILEDLDRSLRQQGVSLETYQKITGTTHEQLHEQYHDEAVRSLRRSLVLGELMIAERIRVSAADIEQEMDKMLAQFGEQASTFRQFLDTPQQRESIANNLLYNRVMERLAQIGKGEAPVLDSDEVEAEATPPAADAEAQDVSGDA